MPSIHSATFTHKATLPQALPHAKECSPSENSLNATVTAIGLGALSFLGALFLGISMASSLGMGILVVGATFISQWLSNFTSEKTSQGHQYGSSEIYTSQPFFPHRQSISRYRNPPSIPTEIRPRRRTHPDVSLYPYLPNSTCEFSSLRGLDTIGDTAAKCRNATADYDASCQSLTNSKSFEMPIFDSLIAESRY